MTRGLTCLPVAVCLAFAACIGTGGKVVVPVDGVPHPRAVLPGTLTVMQPYDLRPTPEHTGLGPGLDNVHLLVSWSVAMLQPSVGGPLVNSLTPFLLGVADSGCGSFVTGDADLMVALPTDGTFDEAVAVPAAIGECLVRKVSSAALFDGVAGLDEAVPPLSTQLVDTKLLSASPGNPWALAPAAQEAHELRRRALATPLPACATPWLLRVHVLHAYAVRYERRVYGMVMPGEDVPPQSPLSDEYWMPRFFRQPPFANVALRWDLYHLEEGRPGLVWDRTMCGSVRGSLDDVPAYARLSAVAMDEVVAALTEALRQDAPAIRSWLDRHSPTSREPGEEP